MGQPERPAGRVPPEAGVRSSLARILVPDAVVLETGLDFECIAPAPSLVSVIVPSYAHEEYVEEALRSVITQSYREIELILIDDCSPDGTFDRAIAALRTSRIPYCAIRRKHAGLEANLNAGVLLSHGGWIGILASDDLYPPRSFEHLMAAARAAGADVAVGPVDDIARDGKFKASRAAAVARYARLSGDALRKALLEEHGSLMIQGMLIARRAYAQVGLYDPSLFASDFDFLLRMASRGLRFAYVTPTTALHRQTRERLSQQHLQASLDSHLNIARRHARTVAEYRRAAARFRGETALNSLHYGHPWRSAVMLARALLTAPLVAAELLAIRLLGRLRRRKD